MCLGLLQPLAAEEPPPVTYQVQITGAEDPRLEASIAAVSETIKLRDIAPTDSFGLIARARADLPRVTEALRSEGFWGGAVRIDIAGRDVTDPLEATEAGSTAEPLNIHIQLTPGPRYRIGHILIRPDQPEAGPALEDAAKDLRLKEGDAARPADILAAEEALLKALRRAGYPFASVMGRDVLLDHDTQSLDITWNIAPGPQAQFGQPSITGTTRSDAAMLARIAARRLEGQPYSPESLERTRRRLMGLGIFDSIRVHEAEHLAPDGRLPVNFAVHERPRHATGASIGLESNYGLTTSAFWEDRNLFGGAEKLRLEGEIARLGETGIENATYRAFATLRTPELWQRDIQSISQIGAVRERLRAYDRDAGIAAITLEHRLSETMVIAAGPHIEAGQIGRDGDMSPYHLYGLLTAFRYDNTTHPLDPRHGQRFSLSVTPYYSAVDANYFTRVLAIGSLYFDISGDGWSILALRGALGSAPGAGRDEITLDKRFYAGGGGSVRGYTYQSLGPRDALNRPLGGASLLELSAEWRQRVAESWGVVAFLDAGRVGEEAKPSLSEMRAGAGLGLRYLTAIGPLRLDIGLPLDRQKDDPGYALYIGLGQAF